MLFESILPKIFIGFVVLFIIYTLFKFIKGDPNCGVILGEIHTPFGRKKWTLMGDGKIDKTETGIFRSNKHKRARRRT